MSDTDFDEDDEYIPSLEYGETQDTLHCKSCGYIGTMRAKLVTDWVPYGSTNVPMITLGDDLWCPECESHDIDDDLEPTAAQLESMNSQAGDTPNNQERLNKLREEFK